MPGEEARTAAVVAIGDPAVLAGYAMAGVRVLPAQTEEEVRAAWAGIRDDVGLALLTSFAAAALGAAGHRTDGPLTVVMP